MKAFILFRDRVTYGKRCLASLLSAGLEPVVVDHGSTWPEAVAWLAYLEKSGVMVLRRDKGPPDFGHPRNLQMWHQFRKACGSECYIITDPDVIPSEGCPGDWVQHLGRLLDRYPGEVKAGLGLRTDNLPDHYSRKQQVIDHEISFWQESLEDGVYRGNIDTTLAMYRAWSQFEMGALRTGFPYVADHLPWHEDLGHLTGEQAYYYEHAEPGIVHWAPHGRSAWKD